MYSCLGQDGIVDSFHQVHYGSRAQGGVGLVICEATGVSPEGRISKECAGLWEDSHIEPYGRVVETIHRGGAKAAIQLNHAGRKSRATSRPLGPSPEAFNAQYPQPEKLSPKEIDRIAKDFGAAAGRAVNAGFDAIEIHGAHGYLISSFLSPLTNHRPDEYGRDRTLFLEQVLGEVRKSIPLGMPLLLRISAHDWAEGGNTPELLGAELSRGILDRYGIAAVHVSSGGVVETSLQPYPGYQIPLAHELKSILSLPIIGGGLIDSPEMAESILQDRRADFIFLARALLRDPYWVLRAAHQLKFDIPWPTQYERGRF